MKRILKITALTLGIIIGMGGGLKLFWHFYDKKQEKEQHRTEYALTPSEKSRIQDGDIILRYGYGLVSDMIVEEFNEEFAISHCGIVLKDSTGNSKVIHSESSSYFSFEGVQLQDLDSFVDASHNNSVMVVRLRNKSPAELSNISRNALYYARKRAPFDYSFDMADSSEIYCAELICRSVENACGINIYEIDNQIDYKQFKNYWDSTYFEVIFNHNLRK